MIQDEIRRLSEKLKFDLIGFAKLKHFKNLEKILEEQEGLGYKTKFQVGNIEDRVFKNSDYKSAIVFGLAYNKPIINEENLNENEIYLSSYCYGLDYHKVIKNKLEIIKKFINEQGYVAEVFVDNNILDERYLAYEAGLGFYGLNNLLINDKYGSYFFIGVILTDATFSYGGKINKTCFLCGKCIEACPTKAINKNGILNGNRCLSYLTQKKDLTQEEEIHFNKCIFGCDICSKVCPHNDNIKIANNFKFSGIELIESDKFQNMSKKEFASIYEENACSWRGKDILDRNIKILEEKFDKKF